MTRNLLLSGGPTHDFDATSSAIAARLAHAEGEAGGFDTTIVGDPAEALSLLRAAAAGTVEPWDLVTVNALRWRMDDPRYADQRDQFAFSLDAADAEVLGAHVRHGGGLLALHAAVISFDGEATWRTLTGASWDWHASRHPEASEVEIEVTEVGRRHAITEGIDRFRILDEVYGFLDEVPGLQPLLTGTHGGRVHPLLWARTVGEGRVVTDLLGHGVESVTHPVHGRILGRAAAWAVGRPTRGSAP